SSQQSSQQQQNQSSQNQQQQQSQQQQTSQSPSHIQQAQQTVTNSHQLMSTLAGLTGSPCGQLNGTSVLSRDYQ
ncbi:unnamed protein product, partial [Protopolystoma xenopodis]